ncbi:MAG: hypothetical protein NC924_04410 [Candidatus Omnitrophica bacterium]|nr:hypothetical protein [Candidatus Omnitrophota bacterium]
MRIKLEDFKTGWYGLSIGLKKADIEKLISMLSLLLEKKDQHFHLVSADPQQNSGVYDIEIYYDNDNSPDTMSISSVAK